jgi:hypothetical protein
MSRAINLYPGSDPTVLTMPQWCDVHQDQNSAELWIDFHLFWSYRTLVHKKGSFTEFELPALDKKFTKSCKNIVFYDWFHGQKSMDDYQIKWLQGIAKKHPVTWITLNPKTIPGVNTIHFDYYWNRSKYIFLNRQQFHKVGVNENYVQYPIHTNVRSKQFLTYHSRSETYREIVRGHLIQHYDGFYNDPDADRWLMPNVPNLGKYSVNNVSPPARMYYDESYVTCLVETQYQGNLSHLVSEKTYDNLLQGRAVLNFATPGFYQHLVTTGWRLPLGIDWSWNDIIDDQQRLNAYLHEIDKLLSRSKQDLHDWFISNTKCWVHNQKMAKKKPYDVVDFSKIKV